MLGTCLLYVGAVLINNGYCGIAGVDGKSGAVMKIFAGLLGVIIQSLNLFWGNILPTAQGSDAFASVSTFQWYAAGTGFLFAFTYLWQAALALWDLDARPYGIYCLFVAINAVFCAYLSYINFDGDFRFTIIWLAWAVLWLTGTIEINLNKPLGNFTNWLAIFEGIFTAWIPGMMMIIGIWN